MEKKEEAVPGARRHAPALRGATGPTPCKLHFCRVQHEETAAVTHRRAAKAAKAEEAATPSPPPREPETPAQEAEEARPRRPRWQGTSPRPAPPGETAPETPAQEAEDVSKTAPPGEPVTAPETPAQETSAVEVVDLGTVLGAAQVPEYEQWLCGVLACRAAAVRRRGFNAAGRAVLEVQCWTSDIGVTAAARLRARLVTLTPCGGRTPARTCPWWPRSEAPARTCPWWPPHLCRMVWYTHPTPHNKIPVLQLNSTVFFPFSRNFLSFFTKILSFFTKILSFFTYK